MTNTILVTGGMGFVGSHTCVALAEAGYRPVILDNLSNSADQMLDRIEEIIGHRPVFFKGDIRDRPLLDEIFSKENIFAVMHFAGLKSVSESLAYPLRYYDNNLRGTLNLLGAMQDHGVRRLAFSSSATVYGPSATLPIQEDSPRSANNPYGRSKLAVEEVLQDLSRSDESWRIACLRYFNPVGAHASGLIGEDPKGIPNNLMPYIAQVAGGEREFLQVFGNDYPTLDGTGIRDYIHVMDLAEGHLAALNYLDSKPGFLPVNLGTGVGTSVLQLIEAFETASGRPVPYRIVPRRPGDVAACWADAGFANTKLGWRARRSLSETCADSWRWQSNRLGS